MTLPLETSYAPMEARSAATLPTGDGWQFEPKWDGFRCLAHRDGSSVDLRSKSGQPLARYFPDVVGAILEAKADRFVIDGEIVVPIQRELSFDDLLQRIHPAASRVERLARETPASFIVFDLLVDEKGKDITALPLRARRKKLEQFFKKHLSKIGTLHLSPCTTDRGVAEEWLDGHAGTDGVMAKRADEPYHSGDRSAMQKIKRMRTADLVVGGFRYASKGKLVGSLLLGLYDDEGLLHHVGFTSSFAEAERKAVTAKVEKCKGGAGFTGRAPGGPSRWSTERTGEWVPLKPVLACEVRYDHWSNDRFRHGTKFLRWRPDKAPRQCTIDQVLDKRREPRRGNRKRKGGGMTNDVPSPAVCTVASTSRTGTPAGRAERRCSSQPPTASIEIFRSSASCASPLMIERQLISRPFRLPFSTTFTPSGAIVIVYARPSMSSSRLIDFSSLTAISYLRSGFTESRNK